MRFRNYSKFWAQGVIVMRSRSCSFGAQEVMRFRSNSFGAQGAVLTFWPY